MKRWAVLILLCGACAHEPMPRPRGEMHDLESIVPKQARAGAWAPSPLYPALEEPRPTRAQSSSAGGPLTTAAWLWLRAYQGTLSRVDGATCRFRPTCSGFGLQALSEAGLLGLPMAFGRLHRSHAAEAHYSMKNPPFLEDPVANYTFTRRTPRLDDFAAYDNPAHAWYQHVRATRRIR